MHERERYQLATVAAETMCNLWELSHQQEELNLDHMMRRLKGLSAHSPTHYQSRAGIIEREVARKKSGLSRQEKGGRANPSQPRRF
jgi:flagellar biosynthesis chaperone FliJ